MARQCLDRRIPSQEELEREVLSCVGERSRNEIKIHWQFSLEKARDKFRRHSQRVRKAKTEPKET